MAEKKKWAPTKMFLQWCLSYLLISVIALTLLLASGYRYLDVLRDNLEYTNGIQLDMTRVWLDQKVKLLRNITAKESSTAAIEAVRQADDYDDIPRYDYYMLTRKISTDVINYGIGDAYFLYFPSTDAIVSNTKYGQSRRFYDLVLEAYDISYEDWMEILKQNLVTTRVFQPVVQGKDSKNYLVLMRPLNITSREPDKAVAVMIVDLEDLFKASDWLNNDTLCINDRNNGVLVANHELPEATENAVTELIKSSGSRKFDEAAHTTSKEEYISIISSTYENWDIAVILKEQAFASKIIDIQKLLAVVVIIYLLLTVAVIANSAAKRYLKLRNVVQVLHRGNAADPEENLTDAFAYIDSRVQKLVQDNVESSDLIEQQRTVMLREQFHAMITNADAANEADTDQLENLGFPIHRAKQYYLLAYRLQEQDLANEKDPDKIYEMQWFILQNVTRENLTSRSLENLCFREGGMQLYIIWTEKEDPEMLESILWSYEYCRSFLAQHFEFRYDIAVSSGHTGLDGVYKTYRDLIIMRTAFAGVPDSLEESAKLDGANAWTILWRIMAPLVKPTVAVITLYYAVSHWNSWFNAMLFLRDKTQYPLQLILRQILIQNDTADMTAGADYLISETIQYATVVVATLPILCIYPFVQKYFVKGVMIGAIKG